MSPHRGSIGSPWILLLFPISGNNQANKNINKISRMSEGGKSSLGLENIVFNDSEQKMVLPLEDAIFFNALRSKAVSQFIPSRKHTEENCY